MITSKNSPPVSYKWWNKKTKVIVFYTLIKKSISLTVFTQNASKVKKRELKNGLWMYKSLVYFDLVVLEVSGCWCGCVEVEGRVGTGGVVGLETPSEAAGVGFGDVGTVAGGCLGSSGGPEFWGGGWSPLFSGPGGSEF